MRTTFSHRMVGRLFQKSVKKIQKIENPQKFRKQIFLPVYDFFDGIWQFEPFYGGL